MRTPRKPLLPLPKPSSAFTSPVLQQLLHSPGQPGSIRLDVQDDENGSISNRDCTETNDRISGTARETIQRTESAPDPASVVASSCASACDVRTAFADLVRPTQLLARASLGDENYFLHNCGSVLLDGDTMSTHERTKVLWAKALWWATQEARRRKAELIAEQKRARTKPRGGKAAIRSTIATMKWMMSTNQIVPNEQESIQPSAESDKSFKVLSGSFITRSSKELSFAEGDSSLISQKLSSPILRTPMRRFYRTLKNSIMTTMPEAKKCILVI